MYKSIFRLNNESQHIMDINNKIYSRFAYNLEYGGLGGIFKGAGKRLGQTNDDIIKRIDDLSIDLSGTKARVLNPDSLIVSNSDTNKLINTDIYNDIVSNAIKNITADLGRSVRSVKDSGLSDVASSVIDVINKKLNVNIKINEVDYADILMDSDKFVTRFKSKNAHLIDEIGDDGLDNIAKSIINVSKAKINDYADDILDDIAEKKAKNIDNIISCLRKMGNNNKDLKETLDLFMDDIIDGATAKVIIKTIKDANIANLAIKNKPTEIIGISTYELIHEYIGTLKGIANSIRKAGINNPVANKFCSVFDDMVKLLVIPRNIDNLSNNQIENLTKVNNLSIELYTKVKKFSDDFNHIVFNKINLSYGTSVSHMNKKEVVDFLKNKNTDISTNVDNNFKTMNTLLNSTLNKYTNDIYNISNSMGTTRHTSSSSGGGGGGRSSSGGGGGGGRSSGGGGGGSGKVMGGQQAKINTAEALGMIVGDIIIIAAVIAIAKKIFED